MFLDLALNYIKNNDSDYYSTYIKTASIDNDENKALSIMIDACEKADVIYKNAFQKESGFITKIVIKTLKVAQAALATMLLKSPFRVALAYNALHLVIKKLEEIERKNEILEKRKKFPLTEKKRIFNELKSGYGKGKWKKIDDMTYSFTDPETSEEFGLEIFKSGNEFKANILVDDSIFNAITHNDINKNDTQIFKNIIQKTFGIRIEKFKER